MSLQLTNKHPAILGTILILAILMIAPSDANAAGCSKDIVTTGKMAVGAAAVDPVARLLVNGMIKITGGGSGITFPDGTVQTSALWTASGNNIYNTNTGNVGIGTATPGAKLDVAGTVQATGFKMPTGAVNNYVLTSDGSGTAGWKAPVASGAISVQNPALLSNGWSNEPNLRDNNVATYASWGGSSSASIAASITYDTGSIKPIIFALDGKADATLPMCGIYGYGEHIGGAGISVQYSYDYSNWYDYSPDISSGGNGQITSSGRREIGGVIFGRYIRFTGSVGQSDSSCPAASGTLYIYEARIMY